MNQIMQQGATVEGDIIDVETTSLAQQLTKAEIDQQIATAHRFPRSRAMVAEGILELATWSPGAAAECNYALPRGGKSLTGPSIRLAEIIAAEYGNCRVGARVVHVDRFEKYVEAEGVFHDLQKNTATTARVRRRIVDSKGRLFNDDMIIVTGNAACSIAKRNAILAAVPKALWMPAYEAALQVIKGEAKTLTERREGALRALGAFGVTPDMICTALEIEGVLEISLDHMPTLIAWHNALKDQTETVESLFPAPSGGGKPAGGSADAPKGTAGKLNDIAKGGRSGEQRAQEAQGGSQGGQGRERTAKPAGDAASERGEISASDDAGADAATEDTASDDQGEGDAGDEDPEVTDEQATEAYERGKAARRKGMKQGAVPPEYKAAQRLFDAWNDGWADADAEGGE